MKAIVFDTIGSPRDVLYLDDIRLPRVGDDEVLVRMVSASINPGDFLFIENLSRDRRTASSRQVAEIMAPALSAGCRCWPAARHAGRLQLFNSWARSRHCCGRMADPAAGGLSARTRRADGQSDYRMGSAGRYPGPAGSVVHRAGRLFIGVDNGHAIRPGGAASMSCCPGAHCRGPSGPENARRSRRP